MSDHKKHFFAILYIGCDVTIFATCASKKWWQSIVGQLGFLCDSTFYKLLIDCVIRLAVKTKMSASNVCQQKNWSQKDEHDSTLRWMSKTDMYRVLHKNLYAKLMKNFQMTRERRQPETGAIERHVWSDIKNLFFSMGNGKWLHLFSSVFSRINLSFKKKIFSFIRTDSGTHTTLTHLYVWLGVKNLQYNHEN